MELTAWNYKQCDADDVCPANMPHVSDVFLTESPLPKATALLSSQHGRTTDNLAFFNSWPLFSPGV